MRCVVLLTLASVVAIQGASPDSKYEPREPPAIQLSSVPELCEVVNPEIASETVTLSSSAQFRPLYVTTIGGIEYSLGLDDLNRVRYIAVDDPLFVTTDGVKAGWTRGQLESEFEVEIRCEPGWACFLALPSGWHAAFRVFDKITIGEAVDYRTRAPSEDDAAVWFFQRGACGPSAG